MLTLAQQHSCADHEFFQTSLRSAALEVSLPGMQRKLRPLCTAVQAARGSGRTRTRGMRRRQTGGMTQMQRLMQRVMQATMPGRMQTMGQLLQVLASTRGSKAALLTVCIM